MPSNQEFDVQSAREIAMAIQAHFAWKTRIQNTIDGTNTETFSPSTASDSTQCVLGKWIEGAGSKYLGNDPVFQTLQKNHAIFHQCAGKTLLLAQEGKKDEAQKSIRSGDFAEASRNVTNTLTELYQRVKKA